MEKPKKRHVVSYEKMSPEVSEAFAEKYPRGFSDYLADLEKYPKPDGTFFYAVTIGIEEDIYLVKIQIETDDLDDVEKWLEGEDVDESDVTGASAAAADDADALPDDNISQYGGDDDSSDA